MHDLFAVRYAWLIPLLPLVGAVVAGFFGARWLKGKSHWPIWAGVLGGAVVSFALLFGMLGLAGRDADRPAGSVVPTSELFEHAARTVLFTWFEAGDPARAGTKDFFRVDVGYFLDPLTAVMLCVVCGIGFLITVFAAGYMKGEQGYFRFFAYLGLFIFMMTNLVMGENLIMLYLGWEGVGLCSYLLIGYYYDKPAAREAAKKAFLVNRVGDFGFAVGIMLCFLAFGTVSYFGDPRVGGDGLLELAAAPALTGFQRAALDWIPFCLMLGAFGKSAQFPLYVWLPDAMEGPTPVSALIHAATMVTAGVYMIARCSTLFVANEAAMILVAVVGAFTALFAGSIAVRQFDLKKVFAYSTVSQLGFMFVAVGVLAPVAGVFHLVTHAFFKALLFLSSGVVMHAMAGELDMRRMSGLKRVLPRTRAVMLVGCAALAGFPIVTSGYWSKDEIIHFAGYKSAVLHGVLLLTAFLTAYYTFRLYFRVFEGPQVVPAAPPAGGHGHTDEPRPSGSGTAAHGVDRSLTVAAHQDQNVDAHLAHGHGHGTAAHGHGHDDHGHGHHDHEPGIMMAPLYVLAAGAVLAGLLNLPFGFAGIPAHALGHFLGQSPSFSIGYHRATVAYQSAPFAVVPAGHTAAAAAHDDGAGPHAAGHDGGEVDRAGFGQPLLEHHAVDPVPLVVGGLVSLAGIGVAYLLHKRNRAQADALADRFRGVVRAIDAKYWVDELYQAGVVEPLRRLGRAFFAFDRYVVDTLVTLVGFVPQLFGYSLKLTVQRGYLQGYASAMLLGVLVILLIVFL